MAPDNEISLKLVMVLVQKRPACLCSDLYSFPPKSFSLLLQHYFTAVVAAAKASLRRGRPRSGKSSFSKVQI